ncbi:MAG: PrsW family glutamic-type intramembrane protease [Heteroscytonema crispum UTEX LB 1556]
MAGKKARQNAFLRLMSASGADTRSEQNYSLLTTREMVIGRDPSCQIALDPLKYRMISRRHAVIRPLSVSPDGGYRWHICDFNSANGTYLNGKLLQGCQELQAGDRITLGNSGPELFFGYEFNSLEATVLTPAKTKPRTANRTSSSEPDDVSLSQLLPIFSTGKDLTRKAYLVPGIITVICVIFLFLASGLAYQTILGSYLAGAAFYFVYQLCGKPKSWFALIAAGIATAIISLLSLGFGLFSIFDGILPGSLSAGLLEELVKVLPVVGAYLIGKVLASPKRERVGVWEPLDGILLGAASSVGFTILETFGLYVPGQILSAAQQSGSTEAGLLAGLQLLIPRVLGEVAGHMAYSGYFGYFIGLSVLKPHHAWRTLIIGYLTAAGLHTLWDAAANINFLLLVLVGVASYAFLAAAILKARALSPTRSQNFATRFMQPK